MLHIQPTRLDSWRSPYSSPTIVEGSNAEIFSKARFFEDRLSISFETVSVFFNRLAFHNPIHLMNLLIHYHHHFIVEKSLITYL